VVLVPEADHAVADLRARLDPAVAMPAHITVLYPFVRPKKLGAALINRLADVFGSLPAFDYELRDVRWFGQDVVYLAPEPAGPFVQLTRAVMDSYPGYRPYRGEFDDIVPHVCVAQRASADEMTAAARVVAERLPIEAHVRDVRLMTYEARRGVWHPRAVFDLRQP